MNNNQDSFFSTVQNLVISGLRKLPNKNKNKQSPWGRYLAICFREVLQENKNLLNKLFEVSKNTEIELEYYYTSDRRADIALLDKDGQVCALIEIKVEDKLGTGQLESYIDYCKKNKTKFFLLTRWLPNEKENNLIKNNGRIITLSEVHQSIKSSMHTNKHPLSKMFCKFLKESKMDYEQKISDDLSFLAQRVFFAEKQDNHVSINKLKDGVPQSLSTIFTNLEIITRDLMVRLNIKDRKLSLNLWFSPYCKVDRLNKLIDRGKINKKEDCFLKDKKYKMIDYGQIWFCSTISLGDSNRAYCNIEFGLVLEIDSYNEKPYLSYYWQITPDKQDVTYDEEPILSSKKDKAWKLPPKEEFVKTLENRFKKAYKDYKKKYAGTASREAKLIGYLRKVFK